MFRQEIKKALELKNMSHQDLGNNFWVDSLEVHFSRDQALEIAELPGMPKRAILGPINSRLLKELGIPTTERTGKSIAEPPNNRIRVAIHTQLKAVDRLLDS